MSIDSFADLDKMSDELDTRPTTPLEKDWRLAYEYQ
uniref:Uncharacterized protein R4.5 n=1 Tax=Haloquadratum walsbyi TaxID=293091 RepID=A0A445MQG9_9EURY|nr:uncharacterized protein R4.5 [Haloquadratum walsbyi]